MTRLVSLQMISLLIFNDHMSSAAAGGSSGCITVEQVNHSLRRFQRRPWRLQVQTHTDLSNRSLSPWTYRIDKDDNRIPHKIPMAECLSEGCIIDQSVNMNYNSVPVFVRLMVKRKTPCPQDPKKFLVNKDFIKVQVGCTCVVPKSMK